MEVFIDILRPPVPPAGERPDRDAAALAPTAYTAGA
jgi:hypothetical protein